jgi:leucyl-tRNA synthetase
MAYYTIAHFLQGSVDGQTVGPAGIKPEQLTRKVWDYIFLGGSYPGDSGIPEETLKKLKHEFDYW